MHTRGAAALIATAGLVFIGTAFGQSTPNPTQQLGTATAQGPTPLFRITVVGHTTPAINYRPRKGDTKVDFTGTALSPLAVGSLGVGVGLALAALLAPLGATMLYGVRAFDPFTYVGTACALGAVALVLHGADPIATPIRAIEARAR